MDPQSDPTGSVLVELHRERDLQYSKGWTPEHDDRHTHPDMAALVTERLGSALSFFPPIEMGDEYDAASTGRVYLVQTAALLVAWIEKIDRAKAAGG